MTVSTKWHSTGASRLGRCLWSAGLASVLAISLAGPSAAAVRGGQAATWTVTAASCASAGGTFALAGRTRTCTTVTEQVSDGEPVTRSASLMTTSWPGGAASSSLIGSLLQRTTVQTVTVQRQRPNRPATVAQDTSTVSHLVPLSCTERRTESQQGSYDRTTGARIDGSHVVEDVAMPITRCAQHGLYAA